jgi:hypothetical protein
MDPGLRRDDGLDVNPTARYLCIVVLERTNEISTYRLIDCCRNAAVIKDWQKSVPMIKEGVIIPSKIGCADRNTGDAIGPKEMLAFDPIEVRRFFIFVVLKID